MLRGKPWLRALVAGLLLAASVPPWGFWPLAFVGMALWVELLAAKTFYLRAGLSALVSVAWMAPATVWMLDLSAVGWPLAVIGFALMHAAAGAIVVPDRRLLAFPAAFALAEFLRWSWPFGGVPLATMAMAQVSGPLASAVRIGGPLLLSGLTAVGGVALAALVGRKFREAAIGVALVVGAALLGSVAPAGEVLPASASATGSSSIVAAVVQGGGPQNTRANICEQRDVFERHIEATYSQVQTPVDLVLWPEDVVHPRPDSETERRICTDPLLTHSEARSRLGDLASSLDAVVVAGFFERTADGEANRNYVSVFDSSGIEVDTYDKVRLVPFGEFVPLRSTAERFSDELPGRDVRPGSSEEAAALDTPIGSLGVVISWEVFFENRARSAIGDGDGLLLMNPTNGSSYWLTVVQSQQIASSRLRALETGRWVLQAAPTGFSAVIDPHGNVIERTGTSESRVIQSTVELRRGDTLAVRLGPWPAAVAAALTVAMSLGAGRLVSRRKPGGKP